jgi:hypothetical protein
VKKYRRKEILEKFEEALREFKKRLLERMMGEERTEFFLKNSPQ